MQTRQTRRTRTKISWRQLLGEMLTRRETLFVVMYLVLAATLEWKALVSPSLHYLWIAAIVSCGCAVAFFVIFLMSCEAVTVYHGARANE